jgi:hypothetical protein
MIFVTNQTEDTLFKTFLTHPLFDSIFPFGQDWRKQIITNKTISNG